MAKVNFRHNKRQKELARKERQSERLARRGERPPEEEALAAPVSTGVETVAHENVENDSIESIPAGSPANS
jgi:hypothetical protein